MLENMSMLGMHSLEVYCTALFVLLRVRFCMFVKQRLIKNTITGAVDKTLLP